MVQLDTIVRIEQPVIEAVAMLPRRRWRRSRM